MDADLTATPTFANGQVTGWQLCYKKATSANDCGDGKTSSPYPKLDFMSGSGGHQIKIDIANGNGITFAQSNPLWIQPNTKPTGPIVAPTDQIDPSKITGGGTTTLKFHDANTNTTLLLMKYQLNFQGGNGLMAIDPDIQNGGKGMAFSQATTLLIAGGVAIALVLLVWGISARRRTNAAR
jgi:hypothetical protein